MFRTIITHPDALWQLDGKTHDGRSFSIRGTAEHPFFTQESGFVPLSKLSEGQTLLAADGSAVWVSTVRKLRGPPQGQAFNDFATYNLEVDGFHTYFAGEPGVLVHNVGAACQTIVRHARKLLKTLAPNNFGRKQWHQGFEEAERCRLAAAKEKWQKKNPTGNPNDATKPWDVLDGKGRCEFLLGHSEEILKDATDATTGAVDWHKVFTYKEWTQHIGRLQTMNKKWEQIFGGIEAEFQHGAPQKHMELLKNKMQGNAALQSFDYYNDTPAFPMPTHRHQRGRGRVENGQYQPSFHDLLDGNAKQRVPGFLRSPRNATPAQIRQAIRRTYEEMQTLYPNDEIAYSVMADVVDQFLLSYGVP